MDQQSERPYLTITAVSKYLATKLKKDPYLQDVWVIGEISNYRPRKQHQYFNLKDEESKISAVMFASKFQKLSFELKEGMSVYARGYIGSYLPTGQYQLYIETMEPEGLGAKYAALEALKEKMLARGDFSHPKRAIPKFPKVIAVITSLSGAVRHDIETTIKRRYPIVTVQFYEAIVQGDKAAPSIIDAFDEIAKHSEIDTVILARGGGSIEDLWVFNDEAVAQAILNCPYPVISSIGHETDTTIADLVADLRAPTPTAAAEMAVPELTSILDLLDDYERRLYQVMTSIIQQRKDYLMHLSQSSVLKHPAQFYENLAVHVDNLTMRLYQIFQSDLDDAKGDFQTLNLALYNNRWHEQRKQLNHLLEQLEAQLIYAMNRYLTQKSHDTAQLEAQLMILSPQESLNRGYIYATYQDELCMTVSQLEEGMPLTLHFGDGTAEVIVASYQKDQKEESSYV